MKFREELEEGEEVFSRRASLIFKTSRWCASSTRTRNALVYLTYSDRVIEGSPKNSISAVVIRDWQAARAVSRILVRAAGPVTLVGGGPVAARQLAQALALAPEAVAADGGGDHPLPEGHAFRAVIGDMDSLRDPRARCAPRAWRSSRSAEQDSTDLEKCLYSVEAPLFIGLGFLGGRIDHHLAAMNALVRHPARPVVLIGGADLCFLCPPRLRDRARGRDAGVALPHGRRSRGMASEGLRWPVTGSRSAPDGAHRHLEHRPSAGAVRLAFDAPRMLVILPAALLGRVVDCLRGAPAAGQAGRRDRDGDRVGHGDEDARAGAAGLRRRSRRFGGTAAVRVKPSGVRKVAMPVLSS